MLWRSIWHLLRLNVLRAIITTCQTSFILGGSFVNVKFKVAFFDNVVGEYHLSIAVLNAPVPLTLVYTTIGPAHLAIAISLIILVLAFVGIAAGPRKHAIAVLLIVKVVSFILVTWLRALGTLPPPFTML